MNSCADGYPMIPCSRRAASCPPTGRPAPRLTAAVNPTMASTGIPWSRDIISAVSSLNPKLPAAGFASPIGLVVPDPAPASPVPPSQAASFPKNRSKSAATNRVPKVGLPIRPGSPTVAALHVSVTSLAVSVSGFPVEPSPPAANLVAPEPVTTTAVVHFVAPRSVSAKVDSVSSTAASRSATASLDSVMAIAVNFVASLPVMAVAVDLLEVFTPTVEL
mmetsp:Transcript_33685/g.49934  ORF Transcript_33685/g.49934 Transcript_33685/m.49934 type:complete len:219 (-) Transcript_33685:325-981(-)